MESKFNVGDKVKIVKYGHLVWCYKEAYETVCKGYPIYSENDGMYQVDMMPEIVGKTGVIDAIGHSITGIPEKHSWYSEDQLILDKE